MSRLDRVGIAPQADIETMRTIRSTVRRSSRSRATSTATP